MNIGIVGSGPAVESLSAALSDIDVAVETVAPTDLGGVDFGAVVAPAGADAFTDADAACDRWVAVEIGGLGGVPLDGLDASVSCFSTESGRYADLCVRIESNRPESAATSKGNRSAVRLAGAIAGRRAVAMLAGDDLGGTVVEVPGGQRQFLSIPTPDRRDRTLRRDYRDVDVADSLARAERAVDERVGLISNVGERESFPVPYYLAATADTSAFSDARAAEYAAGVDADWNVSFMKALGEGLERYGAGIYRGSEFTVAPEAAVDGAVSPAQFVRPANSDYDPEADTAWVEGENVATEETVLLPAEFVHFPPPEEGRKPAITTGLGLGNSGVEALLSGTYEVIERDATMLAWYSTFEPLALSIEDDGFEELEKRARAESLSVTPLLVTQDIDVPVVAVAVHRDGEWPQFAMGSGANLDAVEAAKSALAEALQNWMELRTIGRDRATAEEGAIGTYADSPPASLLECETVVPATGVGPDAVPDGADELRAVVERTTDAGVDVYAARVTPSDVERLGFEAVRVLAPEAQPLFTGAPFFGERAASVPQSLGFEPRLDREHHPYP
ncbi:MAG: YcaO-like family protein [Halobacteriota archaeon]